MVIPMPVTKHSCSETGYRLAIPPTYSQIGDFKHKIRVLRVLSRIIDENIKPAFYTRRLFFVTNRDAVIRSFQSDRSLILKLIEWLIRIFLTLVNWSSSLSACDKWKTIHWIFDRTEGIQFVYFFKSLKNVALRHGMNIDLIMKRGKHEVIVDLRCMFCFGHFSSKKTASDLDS